MMENGVSIIIPTYNGGRIFSRCIDAIMRQDYAGPFQLIVIDSGSTDGTVERAEKAGAFVRKIDQKQFHHARTRNEALLLATQEKIVFTVQDAIPCSNIWLTDLTHALDQYRVAAAYTAQMPHDDATPFSRFEIESINEARGGKPFIQQIESLESYAKIPYPMAYRTIGLDNVCAIYRKERLLKAPFPVVDFAEDMAWAHKNLAMGHKILYTPDIKVKHSHNRSPQYAFSRQIVNSFWCARIMKRTEEDLSFLTVTDLMTLTQGILGFVSGLRSNILAGSQEWHIEDPLLQGILKKYPISNRVRRFLADRLFRNQKRASESLRRMVNGIEIKINTLFRLVRKKYGIEDPGEQISLLDQVVANTMGRAYGEVYASRLLAGNLSPSLESLMRPFFYGV